MNSPAYDIAKKIAAESLATFGGSTGWVVDVNKALDNPDGYITVSDIVGRPGDNLSRVEFDHWSVQLRVRGSTRDAVVDKLDAITKALNLIKNYSVVDGLTTITYIVVYRESLPYLLEYDERNRPVYVQTWSGMRDWTL